MNGNDTFSIDVLNSIQTYDERIKYCEKTLGKSLGEGTSRIVFSLNDKKVLKLAKGKYGNKQNKTEYETCSLGYNNLFPKVYDSEKDYKWIISQKARRANYKDFEIFFNVPKPELVRFIRKQMNPFIRKFYNSKKYQDKNSIFFILSDFYEKHPNFISDIAKLSSWGVIKDDDNNEHLVIIDAGLNLINKNGIVLPLLYIFGLPIITIIIIVTIIRLVYYIITRFFFITKTIIKFIFHKK